MLLKVENKKAEIMSDAFSRAVDILGGKSAMARRFNLTPWAVSKWASRVPAERCPDIERMTDGAVRCEDLRPDVDWSVLRAPVPCVANHA